MSLVKQIQNKGAVSCWSPQINFPNLIALGTKESAGSGFEDHGGEIEIHELKFADPSLESICKGKLRASSRFTSIAWSPMTAFVEQFHLGLIAGGMIDGIVNIWNPHLIVENVDDALLVSLEQHQGSVTAVDFNPHKESTHLLATGGSDGEVYVISLDNLEMPTVFIPAPNTVKHTADITQVKWNTQVAHILASSSQNGSCFVWDLRQKRAWCELRDPMGGSVSDIAWNPDQGLHIITASGDDRHPVLKLWDLRSSTSLPLATLSGHTEGILSIDWCPHDTSLLISCGKDSKTFLWDLFQLQPVYELPTQQFNGVSEEVNIFTSIASTASHRKYRASWSPCIPAVLSTSSFDRRIQFHSMTGFRSKPAKAPKWLRRNVSASFGFGGKLVVIDNIPNAAGKKTPVSVKIHVHQVVENFEVVNQSDEFHSSVAKGSYSDVCSVKSKTSDPDHRDVWELMRVICFGKNAREELLSFLGFDSSVISDDAKSCHTSIASSSSSSSLEEMIASIQTSHQSKLTKLINSVELAGAAEPTVRKSLIVGNFDMAVECCLASGLLAEALLLAQCGGPELKAKTQAAFFEKQRQEYSFLNVLHAVIKNQLSEYVRNSDLSAWKETLALLSTYGKSEEFPSLCETLAGRLEEERNNKKAAALCYMCAANVARTIHFWVDELISANNRLGQLDVSALQDFVEKVVIFTHANPVDDLGEDCGRFFAEYATILANQGRLSSAANYLKGDSTPIKVLADRIYHAGSKPAGSRPPVFPFDRANVESNPLTLEHKSKVVTQGITPVKSDTTKLSMIPSTPVQKQENTVIAPSQTSVPNAGITSRLPAGWVQLVDPQSNRVYFANQTTGHSQWEPPDFPAESVSFESKVLMQTSEVPASLEISETPKLNQSDATRSNEFDCVIALGQMIEAIAALNLSAPEKKQVTMLRSNFQILLEKMKNEELSPEIMEKLSLFTDALVNRNYSGASLIQTDLTNTAWSQHKEWLKGLKILIQLAIKK